MNTSRAPELTVLSEASCSAGPLTGGMSADAATELARQLKALADPARLRLLSLIADSPSGAACACDLTEPLGLSQPTVSHHLKVLVDGGFLEREKRGVWAWYSMIEGAVSRSVEGLPGLAQLTERALSPAPARAEPAPAGAVRTTAWPSPGAAAPSR